MAGLVILAIMIGYLIISLIVVQLARKTAKKYGGRGWVWGWVAALMMYNLVFWDWIPTVAMHQYACNTEGGFWVYKTPEQWEKENPGVLETLVSPKNAPHTFEGSTDSGNYTFVFFTNDRFRWVVKNSGPHPLNLWREEQKFVDVKTGEVLAKYVDFASSQIRPTGSWQGWKFWLYSPHCAGGDMNESLMLGFKNSLKGSLEE
ncbi:hypothetical protein A9404_03885 [Halothiobacillus diazotrophicus]|uniref:Uncharacterized protein n=1 Tax=Halothiobacillus diazotrophicus TaxID=1860122 RepID=A0A191ZFJ9_9GAMM|nr:hypothetical protein [Halothiobacillus diazotrophicus]ANJ66632.1 hypothetical protein A9404_03885 [Halothiobacillus diazotrophicus]